MMLIIITWIAIISYYEICNQICFLGYKKISGYFAHTGDRLSIAG